jgi:peptide/nickel transport system substrate-binding protein
LRVSNGGDPPDLDVLLSATYLAQFICAPCYSTLFRIDPDDYSRLEPDLAEAMDVSADGRTVTFRLRPRVLFHNGETLVADDVVYSINRARNPPKGFVSPRKGLLGNIASIEAPDPLTVVMHLKQPQADFPFLVSNPFNAIYCRKFAEPLDAAGQGMKHQVMGTGAFRMERFVDGQIYELVRFDKYFGPPASLDRVQIFPIAGEVERGVALQGKRLDVSFFFASEAVIAMLRRAPGITALRRPTPTFVNMIINVQRKPFDDPRVREALSLAVDRSAFIKTVGPLSGAFFHSLGLMPPDSQYSLDPEQLKQFPGYDTLPGIGGDIAANRRQATSLLEQAGVARGFKITIPTRGDIPAFRDGAINVAAQLNTIGLDASVDVRDAGGFYAIENGGDFQLIVHSVAVSGSLPDQIFGEGYTSFGGRNYGHWHDDAIDAAFWAQSQEIDPAKRTALIRQFQLAFLKTNYHIHLAWVGYGAAYSNALKGWKAQPDLYANMQLDRIWLET